MTHRPAGRPAGADNELGWLALGLGAALMVVSGGLWLCLGLAAALVGHGWSAGPFKLGAGPWMTICRHDTVGPWWLATTLAIGLAAACAIAAGWGWAGWQRRLENRRRWEPARRLARRADIRSLTEKARRQRVAALRPQLGEPHKAPVDEIGDTLGNVAPKGRRVLSSFEDVELDLMAPRAGKTTSRAVPAILRAPGAALVTSNKLDVWECTHVPRSRVGTVWRFDPQGISAAPADWYVNLLYGIDTDEGADRLAQQFMTPMRSAKNDF